VISTTPRYNNIYGRTDTGSKSNVQYTTESQTFEARVYYVNMDEEYLSNNDNQQGTQNKIILPDGSVKIVVKSDAYEFLQEARRVELDGIRFAIKSDGSPRGLTINKFYTFLLTPTDE
jgi:glutathione synthase/RimK-type ligase-like ATP-grasp enzyme